MATVMGWNPFHEIAGFQEVFDRFFDENWRNSWQMPTANALALDLHENAQAYTLYASLPGVTQEQINITFQEDELTINVEFPQPTIDENTSVLVQERPIGRITRSLRLPMPVNTDAAEARYENGVLVLVLPKTPEAQPRQIPVRAVNSALISQN